MSGRRGIFLASVFAALLLFSKASAAGDGDEGYARIMEGPMVGYVSDVEAYIWFRASGPFEIGLVYSENESLEPAWTADPISVEKENDFTGRFHLTGLNPETAYWYKLTVNGGPDKYNRFNPPPSFRTQPPQGKPAKFSVAFGSCINIDRDPEQPIWNPVMAAKPNLFLLIGDNIYGDALDIDILREQYRRNRHVRSRIPMLQSVPQAAIWDDHDYGLNNSDRDHPAKDDALKAFKEYWANPSYGLPEAPGVFFKFTIADVDFFMLDDRYHRSPNEDPNGPEKTHLGKAQLDWLKKELKASRGVFKVLVDGGGWNEMKGPKGDSWSACLEERDDLFNFIGAEKIEGVFLLSGDTHVAEMNAMPWAKKGAYDFYELVSSPLAQWPAGGMAFGLGFQRLRPVYNGDYNFGLIEFDTAASPPTAVLKIVNSKNELVWEPLALTADDLKIGVSSWKNKRLKEKR